MDYFPRKSLSKYLTDTIDFNKHVHDLGIHNSKLGIKTGYLSMGMGPKFVPREMAEKSLWHDNIGVLIIPKHRNEVIICSILQGYSWR